MTIQLNKSWLPTVFGIVGSISLYLSQLGTNLPSTAAEWGTAIFAGALGGLGLSAKQFNVTNSPIPVQPQTVNAATLPPAVPPVARPDPPLVMPPYPG